MKIIKCHAIVNIKTSNFTPTGEKRDRRKDKRVKDKLSAETVDKSKVKSNKRRGQSLSEINLTEETSKLEEDATTTAKDGEMKDPDDLENHAQKLIQDVHQDESLLASLKQLMERSDLNDIIMGLDFVNIE